MNIPWNVNGMLLTTDKSLKKNSKIKEILTGTYIFITNFYSIFIIHVHINCACHETFLTCLADKIIGINLFSYIF